MIFKYDKTFEGLLTAVFDAYARRSFPESLLAHGEPEPLFAGDTHVVCADPARADRVWKGLRLHAGRRVCNMLLHAWLSEEPVVDELIFRYLRKFFDTRQDHAQAADMISDFSDPDVLAVHKIALKVAREGEHVRQFLRFQKGADGSYFAPVAPKYNALPLAVDYLADRFADQRWLVYDTHRHYGYLYDLQEVKEVSIEDDAHLLSGCLNDEILAGDERLFQQTWRDYLGALTIRERLNPRLQRQHMPRRFWKYLTEKQ
jgi:probable DNA metabolism protein